MYRYTSGWLKTVNDFIPWDRLPGDRLIIHFAIALVKSKELAKRWWTSDGRVQKPTRESYKKCFEIEKEIDQ